MPFLVHVKMMRTLISMDTQNFVNLKDTTPKHSVSLIDTMKIFRLFYILLLLFCEHIHDVRYLT